MFTFPKWVLFVIGVYFLGVFIGTFIYPGAYGLDQTQIDKMTGLAMTWQNLKSALVWDFPWLNSGYWQLIKIPFLGVAVGLGLLIMKEILQVAVGFVRGII